MSAPVSPLEQLEQQSAKAQPSTQAAPASNLSPLEQLEQTAAKPKQPTQPNAFEQATASGPFAPAGAAEKAMGAEIGDNKAQAVQALKSMGNASLATAGGVLGASGVGEFADPVVASVVTHLGKVKAILDAAGKMGLTTGGVGMGIKEARDLYKEFTKENK